MLSALQDCRRQTLALVADLPAELLCTQAHPDFSPVGWHLGHIAYTESLWIAEHLAGWPKLFPRFAKLFAADGLPKAQRQQLPARAEILRYLAEVRCRTVRCLESPGSREVARDDEVRLWHWLIQHESQHLETMTMVLAMHGLQRQELALPVPARQIAAAGDARASEMVPVAAGEFVCGSDAPEAIDNERSPHKVWLDRYWIDRAPVTCGQYRQFIESGGYQQAKWWSERGWQWQQQAQAIAPLYWPVDDAFDDRPVCGVSWYEAEAYARSVGKRLPTESEWAKAIAIAPVCNRTTGQVWEWTDTWFAPYPGFRPFPYEGYSQLYFDGEHRVLRGGSWATLRWVKRSSFRNWYHPHRRELFAGFRCAA